jgi:hypothetical protein
MDTITIKRSAGRNTLTDTAGIVHDLSRYFTVTRDRQGIRADRAGEFHRGFVVPVRDWFFRAA